MWTSATGRRASDENPAKSEMQLKHWSYLAKVTLETAVHVACDVPLTPNVAEVHVGFRREAELRVPDQRVAFGLASPKVRSAPQHFDMQAPRSGDSHESVAVATVVPKAEADRRFW
eukprot:scaffold775_cov274-Pinguiococcus_pyrenoidosus.AAC.12